VRISTSCGKNAVFLFVSFLVRFCSRIRLRCAHRPIRNTILPPLYLRFTARSHRTAAYTNSGSRGSSPRASPKRSSRRSKERQASESQQAEERIGSQGGASTGGGAGERRGSRRRASEENKALQTHAQQAQNQALDAQALAAAAHLGLGDDGDGKISPTGSAGSDRMAGGGLRGLMQLRRSRGGAS
jgi:hypothetical protein